MIDAMSKDPVVISGSANFVRALAAETCAVDSSRVAVSTGPPSFRYEFELSSIGRRYT